MRRHSVGVGDLKKELSEIPHKMKDFWEESVKGFASGMSSSTDHTAHTRSSFSSSKAGGMSRSASRSNYFSDQRSEYDKNSQKTPQPSFDLGSHLTTSDVSIGSRSDRLGGGAYVADLKRMQTSALHSRSAARQATFSEIDRKGAVKMVQRGQTMEVVSQGHGLGMRSRCPCLGCCCRCVKKCSKMIAAKRTCYFVVMENTHGHSELRWDSNPDRAVTQLAQGRLLLSEIRDVTPVVVQDDVDADLPISRKFRILYGHSSLKLWAPDRESMKEWCVALVSLMRTARGSNMRTKQGPDIALRGYINQIFMSIADKSKSIAAGHVTHISPPELADWLRKLNISASDEYVGDIIQEFDKDDDQALDLEEFSELFHMLTVKEPLAPWFEKYAGLVPLKDEQKEFDFTTAHRAMSAARFQLFLELEQGEKRFFSQYKTVGGPDGLFASMPEPYTEVIEGETLLTQAGFSRLMCCAENDLFDPERRAHVFQDMTQPLSHYWIATSHNTYLEGHQLVGLSSLEQYMDVLLRGCRCVEIDCWDGEDGEPMVTHGWTATSRLQFKDVIRVCRDYAFVTSHYPLILSLEVHCSHEQRSRMASILMEVLGDKLLLHVDTPGHPQDHSLTSPEAARNKVIVKAKRKNRPEETVHSTATDSARIRKSLSKRRRRCRCCRFLCLLFFKCIFCRCFRRRRAASCGDVSDKDDADDEELAGVGNGEKMSGKRSIETDETKSLSDVIYLEGVHFPKAEVDKLNGADLCMDAYPCSCISMNDTKAGRLLDSNGLTTLQRYSKYQILRVYPHAKRVGSSNFDPFSMWLAGVQMVALNYQSLDLPVICNEGLFLHENGGSGFVLKPALVRGFCDPGGTSSPGDSLPIKEASFQTGAFGPPKKKTDVTRMLSNGTVRTASLQPSSYSKRRFSPRGSPCGSKTLEAKIMDISKVRAQGARSGTRQDREDALGAGLICMLELTVLSAHSLPKPCGDEEGGIVSPLVRASICGLPEDRRCAETWVITDNGFNPRWHQLFSFEISEPSMAMLILEVINVSVGMRRVRREFLAAAALPFSGIREGIRWVPLLDWKHHAIELCGLLVEVRLRGPWAELRRYQRLLREPAPPSIAGEISRGPGGLNHDSGGVLSASRRQKCSRISVGGSMMRHGTDALSNYSSGETGNISPLILSPRSHASQQIRPRRREDEDPFYLGSVSLTGKLETIRACTFEDEISMQLSDGTGTHTTSVKGVPSYAEVVEALSALKDDTTPREQRASQLSMNESGSTSAHVAAMSSARVQPYKPVDNNHVWLTPQEEKVCTASGKRLPATLPATPPLPPTDSRDSAIV